MAKNTKKRGDKIIAQANRILRRRSRDTIYLAETGGGEGYVDISMYIVLPNGDMADYDEEGKISRFTSARYGEKSFRAKELPEDLLFSFRHGVNHLLVDEKLSGHKWTFDDLIYDKVDKEKWEEERQNIKTARKLIKTCETIDDVYTLYDKYLREVPIPYDIIFKAFKIFKYEPDLSDLFNGEIGAFGFEQSIVFFSIMQDYETKKNNKQ